MTRALVLATLLLGISATATARRVIMRPSLANSCRSATSWDGVASCVKRFGTLKVVRQLHDARLIQVTPGEGMWSVEGVYLYVHGARDWHLGGMVVDRSQRVIGLSQPTFDGRKTYRIDLAYAASEDIALDGVTARRAYVRRNTSLFCGGQTSSCAFALTACDVFIGGKLYATFRGTPTYAKGGLLKISGDRTRAGDQCASDEEQFLPLPDDDGLDQ